MIEYGHDIEAMAGDPDIQRELRQIEAEFANAESDGLNPAPPTPHPLQTWLAEWYATPNEYDAAWWEEFEADLAAHRVNFAERLDVNEE